VKTQLGFAEASTYGYAGNGPTNATDPSGLDYTLSYSPGVINVNAAITIYGPGATAETAALWQKYITDFWNNNLFYACPRT